MGALVRMAHVVDVPVVIAVGKTNPLLQAIRQGIRLFLIPRIITRVALVRPRRPETLATDILITLLEWLTVNGPAIAIAITPSLP